MASSAFFLYKIFLKLFDTQTSRYAAVLFSLLPAIQVYYLANIYAIVTSLVLGVVYFYLHEDKRVSIAGGILCLFLGTFISFLFVYVILFLFVFEMLNSYVSGERTGVLGQIENFVRSLDILILIGIGVGLIYGLLYLTLGFNYINTFLYASSLENPDGFMLFSNPIQYLTTRVQNILDIMIFFGPILLVFCYRGLKILREKAAQDKDAAWKFLFVLSALVALLLLFLTGAPKKGETARICMFILPFLLIPVMEYLNEAGYPHRERIILLVLVFGQAVFMQLIGVYVW